MEKATMIFISGGVRSGKSTLAENMAMDLHKQIQDSKLHYIACGVASDKEMTQRISQHQRDRLTSGAYWETWEYASGLDRIAQYFGKSDILVLDCVTTLLNNYFFNKQLGSSEEIIQHVLNDIFSLKEAAAHLVLVSNEVVQEVPHLSDFVQTYQYCLGKVHQHIVEQAEAAYLVEAGIPICMKGGRI